MMSRVISYPPVPEAHRGAQEFFMDTLKDKYYQRQSLRNLGLALIKFFDTWVEKDKDGYHVRACAQGDEGEIKVFYQSSSGEDKIVLMIIKQGGEK